MPRALASTDPFLAVADPTRRAILDRLRSGDAAASEIAAGFAISRPAVSRHLRVLRSARLVDERRGGSDGRQRVYRLTPAPLRDVVRWAERYASFWPGALESLRRQLEPDADAPSTENAGPARGTEDREP